MVALEEKVEALLKLSQQNQNKNAEDISSHAFSPQSQKGSGIQGATVQMENRRCQLLHWYKFDEEEVVAEGKIASTDPSAKVHHMPLGRDCWKVVCYTPLKWDRGLLGSSYSKGAHAIGLRE